MYEAQVRAGSTVVSVATVEGSLAVMVPAAGAAFTSGTTLRIRGHGLADSAFTMPEVPA